jgi:hypothetical protein
MAHGAWSKNCFDRMTPGMPDSEMVEDTANMGSRKRFQGVGRFITLKIMPEGKGEKSWGLRM